MLAVQLTLLALAILCGIGLIALMCWDGGVSPTCRTCGERHVDNSPQRIGGYQPCPMRHPTMPRNQRQPPVPEC